MARAGTCYDDNPTEDENRRPRRPPAFAQRNDAVVPCGNELRKEDITATPLTSDTIQARRSSKQVFVDHLLSVLYDVCCLFFTLTIVATQVINASMVKSRIYEAVTLIKALAGNAAIMQLANITADSYTVMVRPNPQTTLKETYAYYDPMSLARMLYNQYLQHGGFYQVVAINRSDFDWKTRLWLKEPHGTWQNGWYTFPDGLTRYYSHMQNDLHQPKGLGVVAVVYDGLTENIVDCTSNPTFCQSQQLMMGENVVLQKATALWDECVCIQDKGRNGLMWYSVQNQDTITLRGGLRAVVANLSIFGLLLR
ncbi:hypothetical protein AC1031_018534 [Aphanomyces cochlioides]|nr:hypothetical protein AC1031_018534 [Aphanomyces cochlioides]